MSNRNGKLMESSEDVSNLGTHRETELLKSVFAKINNLENRINISDIETKLLKITIEEENKAKQKDDSIERRLSTQFQNSSYQLNVTLHQLMQNLGAQIEDRHQRTNNSESEIKALKEKISNLEEKIDEESKTVHELNHRLGNTTAYLHLRAGEIFKE